MYVAIGAKRQESTSIPSLLSVEDRESLEFQSPSKLGSNFSYGGAILHRDRMEAGMQGWEQQISNALVDKVGSLP